jgi:hypothetical protein
MCEHTTCKTITQFAPITIGILEDWNDGIMFSDKGKNTESVTGIIKIEGKIIKRIVSLLKPNIPPFLYTIIKVKPMPRETGGMHLSYSI